jgi:hypothetical protein
VVVPSYGPNQDIPEPYIQADKRRARTELVKELVHAGVAPKDAKEHADRVVKGGQPVRKLRH